MKQKYIVQLTETERSQLKELISSGEAAARPQRHIYHNLIIFKVKLNLLHDDG